MSPCPRQSGLHRPDRNSERKPNFFIAQPVNLSQHKNRALVEGQLLQGAPDMPRYLILLSHLIGFGETSDVWKVSMSRHMFMQRHLLGLMTSAPPPPPVGRLRYNNAIDPGTQRRLAPELAQRSEHPKEDLLGQIQRFLLFAQQVQRQLIHHTLMVGYQPGAGRVVTGQTLMGKRPVCHPLGVAFGRRRCMGGLLPRKRLCGLHCRLTEHVSTPSGIRPRLGGSVPPRAPREPEARIPIKMGA